ncbi:hypothetical protein PFMG_04459 [Plasmodium falciparum IGH-CR14]|uniref:Uncharacterized protein n=1 Tax=Plasmodium falciparum IGH-CR14 TaxID=580059 RepID=A0A0L1IF30_PLAFA|nr:hypothetical protein PFMG_04459 [Plasmodium falciparum IGH-CR14]
MIYLEPLESNDKKEDNWENNKINEDENNDNCENIFLSAKEKRDNEINRILKNMKKEERNLCFPLLDLYFLNKNFKWQNLKESLELPNNVNEYINLNLLKKEIFPKDIIFQNDQKKKHEKTWIYNKLIKSGLLYDKKIKDNIINKLNNNYNIIEKSDNIKNENNHNIIVNHNFPCEWINSDDIIGTFNPIYNARDKIINDNYISSVPTIDIFYNSSKLLTIQTIFEPINHYIYLLRLLPKFSLPLYDSGILQYVCEDPILNGKLKGLELSYRLLVHDILFYAFFSYLSDLPFWAKPPIEILRIYNYESLYSFNDCESEHTERLVFHNIKSIIYNFSDTLNKIELLYPKNYYITIFPNIYFKNIIDFLKSEKFKLKKMIILLKGTNYMDLQKLNYIKSIFYHLRGDKTEQISCNMNNMMDMTIGGAHIKINKAKAGDLYECDHDYKVEKKGTQYIIEAMKKCSKGNPRDKWDEQSNTSNKKKNKNNNKKNKNNNKKNKNNNKKNKNNNNNDNDNDNNDRYTINSCMHNHQNYTISNHFDKLKTHECYVEIANEEKGHNNVREHICTQSILNNIINSNDQVIMTKETNDNIDTSNINNNNNNNNNDNSQENNNFHVYNNNNYNIHNCAHHIYCQMDHPSRENNITLAFKNENKSNSLSSELSNSDDDTDDENIDGFFKTKKLKTTVYDKSTFSFSKFVNKIINYEKIIDYLNNDPQRQEKEDSKIKFFVKMLLFEKRYSSYDVNNDEIDIHNDENTNEGFFQSYSSENTRNVPAGINEDGQEIFNTNSYVENIHNDVNDSVSNSSDYISNLIQNFRRNYVSNNFLSFSRNAEKEQENNMNIETTQDNFTSITFNFN